MSGAGPATRARGRTAAPPPARFAGRPGGRTPPPSAPPARAPRSPATGRRARRRPAGRPAARRPGGCPGLPPPTVPTGPTGRGTEAKPAASARRRRRPSRRCRSARAAASIGETSMRRHVASSAGAWCSAWTPARWARGHHSRSQWLTYRLTMDTPPFTVRILSGAPPWPRSADRFLPTVPWTMTGKSHLTPPLVVPASRWPE